jgi:hypothetical protein
MSGHAKAIDRLDRLAELLERGITAAIYAAVIVGLMCLIVLFVAATYAIIHKGNDFGGFGGGAGDRGGDVIIMPRSMG